MANNLRKFNTEAEYSTATLNYPNVSWVVSGDTVHYTKSEPTPPNDKLMIAFRDSSSSGHKNIIYANCGAEMPSYQGVTNITINDNEVPTSGCSASVNLDQNELCLVKYTLSGTEITDWFDGDLGGWGSDVGTVEVFYPSQITSIGNNVPSNASVIVCEATTPPYIEGLTSTFSEDIPIYVPDSAVNDYKSDVGWREMLSYIYPISEYSGDLPV